MHRFRLSILLLLTALLFTIPAHLVAQETPTADAAPETSAPPPIPEQRASARATVRTFLEAFDPELQSESDPLAAAAACLDLTDLPESVRAQKGEELAVELKEILDRVELIRFETISAKSDADPWILPVRDAGQIIVAPTEAGEWLFTAETVRAVPDLLRAVRGQEIVEGVVNRGPQTLAMWLRDQTPAHWRDVGFLLEHWQWIGLFTFLLLGLILDLLVTLLIRTAVDKVLKRHMTQIPPDRLARDLRPLGLLAAALFWRAAIVLFLNLPVQLLTVLIVAVHFVAICAFVWAAYRMVDIIAAVLEARAQRTAHKFDDLLVPLFRKSTKVFVVILGFVFIADNLDVEITSLMAGVGVGGLAVALAAQDAVRNLFGSLTVITDRPFSVGDWVVIDGIEGSIEELGFRSTRIRTFYNSLVTLPNANLINASVDNYGARQFRRWSTRLHVTYSTPPEKIEAFCAGVRELIAVHPYTRKDFYQVHLNEFGASSLEILLYVFFEAPDWQTELRERHHLSLDILRLAQQLEVEFAFSTQTLHLHRGDASLTESPAAGFHDRAVDSRRQGEELARSIAEGTLGGLDHVPPPATPTRPYPPAKES